MELECILLWSGRNQALMDDARIRGEELLAYGLDFDRAECYCILYWTMRK